MADAISKEFPCDTCGSNEGRYCCPGCSKRSCSVDCVQHHKQVTGCSGKRCVTQFVPISQFNDSNLRSDYFFLENVIRFTDSASRDKIKRSHYQSQKRSKNMSRLRGLAKSHGVNLFLAPVGLYSHKTNTSYVRFDQKTRVNNINWRIHWNFVDCDLKFVDKSSSEHTVLQELLDKYIHHTKSCPLIRHRLQQYVLCTTNVKVFMKVERIKGKSIYYLLDKDISLGDNLKGKVIIEHPTLWVTCKDDQHKFPQSLTEGENVEGTQEVVPSSYALALECDKEYVEEGQLLEYKPLEYNNGDEPEKECRGKTEGGLQDTRSEEYVEDEMEFHKFDQLVDYDSDS